MQRHYPIDPATGVENPALAWTTGVPSTGVEGSYPPAQLCTNPQDEILNVITAAGIDPSDADLTQLLEAINQLILNATPTPETINGTEGVKVTGATVSLNFPGLTEQDVVSPTDLVSFYQTVDEGGLPAAVHRKTTAQNLASVVRGYSPSRAIYTTSGTYTPPAGVNRVFYQMWGGGGGGGPGLVSGASGSGGGSGAYVEGYFTVVPGTAYPVIIGAGGGAASTTNGGDGGDTTFGGAIAGGGKGGKESGSGAQPVVGAGGTPMGGTTSFAGNQGGQSGTSPLISGSGGSAPFGGGGGAPSSGNGGPGAFPAGGGSGSCSGGISGAGIAGAVIISAA